MSGSHVPPRPVGPKRLLAGVATAALAALAVLALTVPVPVPAAVAGAARRSARASARHELADPRANRRLRSLTVGRCNATPDGRSCVAAALADINAARASEGVRPMRLPSNFRALTAAQQLLVISDLERVDRGLVPALGLARRLNRDAVRGARGGGDPVPSSPFYGDAYGSNWEGGYASTLEADFLWMYDDGPGSSNLDCPAAHGPGCWGHRHDILGPYQSPVVMGAASARGQYGVEMTELFIGGDAATGPGRPDAPSPPLWSSFKRLR